MPVTNKLTELSVKKAAPKDKPYKLADGGGLNLQINPNSSKYWRLKYRYTGKEKTLALGVYPEVSLAEARALRDKAKANLKNGVDPSQKRKEQKLRLKHQAEDSFKAISEEYVEKRKQEGIKPNTLKKMIWLLKEKLYPGIGSLPMHSISPALLLSCLKEIEKDGKHETANRAKSLAGRILRYAVATGRADRDVSQDLKGSLITPKVKHRAAILDTRMLGNFLLASETYSGTPTVKAALLLTPILFQRPGELRSMEWSEINWEEAIWEIPAEKMKMAIAHTIPLPTQAIAILKSLEPLTGHGKYVFPSTRGASRPLSDNGVRTAIRTMGFSGEEVSPHGFRATARTLLDEKLNYRVDYIEQQLSHAVKDANGRAYNRTKHLEQRREMMQAWADFLDHLKA